MPPRPRCRVCAASAHTTGAENDAHLLLSAGQIALLLTAPPTLPTTVLPLHEPQEPALHACCYQQAKLRCCAAALLPACVLLLLSAQMSFLAAMTRHM